MPNRELIKLRRALDEGKKDRDESFNEILAEARKE
jgi:hypothetical protein